MTDENIMHELTGRRITITERVFSYPNYQGSVYHGTYKGNEVGIKVKYYGPSNDNVRLEYQGWKDMQHQNVIRLFDCFWAWSGSYWYIVFVMEWCLLDAGKDIVERKGHNRPFGEAELWSIAKGLVDALATMQSRGFAHRNLKLQNIYPFPDAPKIGDFSCSSPIQTNSFKTVGANTSQFLSPELRIAQAYGLAFSDNNTFKADVYSLGVVLLSLAKLEVPQCFQQAQVQVSAVDTEIQGLAYTDNFKAILRAMLAERVDSRWDFLQLNAWLQN